MKLTHTRFLARCILALAAVGAASAQAGPVEDTARAETLIRSGNFVSAMDLLRQAAQQNHAPAQARLADLLLLGLEGEALVLYRAAAAQGEPAGEYGLGRMFAEGLGGLQADPAAALEWYRKAEAKNHGPAVDALARAHRYGDLGLDKDEEKARELDARAKRILQSAPGAAK